MSYIKKICKQYCPYSNSSLEISVLLVVCINHIKM